MTRRPITWALALVLLVVLALMLTRTVRQMTYPAPPVRVPSPPPGPLEEVRLELADGVEVVAWAGGGDGLPAGAPVALFFHGNGENLETMRRGGLFEELAALDVAFLAADYPGYGRSGGRPGEEGVLATGDAAVEWARRRFPERPIVVCGWSLGAAVAVASAAAHPEEVDGLVAMSPWTTLEDVASVHFPRFLVRVLLPERYDSVSEAQRVRMPALVVHGGRDSIIPVEQGRRLAESLAGPTRWVPVAGAGHNDLLAHGEVWRELAAFLDDLR